MNGSFAPADLYDSRERVSHRATDGHRNPSAWHNCVGACQMVSECAAAINLLGGHLARGRPTRDIYDSIMAVFSVVEWSPLDRWLATSQIGAHRKDKRPASYDSRYEATDRDEPIGIHELTLASQATD